ncbi:MAG: hypothetical protein GY856_36610 [bacterium]|nr:hypothetical protein [bacterium]
MTAPLTEVREHLIAALHADLVGPFLPPTEDGEEAEEILRLPPSRWYLTGFLAPARGRELEASDGSDDEELPAGRRPSLPAGVSAWYSGDPLRGTARPGGST